MPAQTSKTTPLLPVEDGISLLLKAAKPVKRVKDVPLKQLLGCVLAEDVVSEMNVPPHDNSAMDGYAVRCSEVTTAQTALPLSGRIQAGDAPSRLAPGTTMRIFTGAPVPEGCDGVVMQENTSLEGGNIVRFHKSPTLGENIRKAGEDIGKGSIILPAGRRLTAPDIGLLASIGRTHATAYEALRVAFFSTGDELTEPGEPLKGGSIYNSNRYMLHGLLTRYHCVPIDLGRIPDTHEATVTALKEAAATADLILSTGGVSVGEEDHVRAALEEVGQLEMWRLRMKPGKPLAFGHIGEACFMGLPGNPVSVFATFMIFARPLINALQGGKQADFASVRVALGFEISRPLTRREFMRVTLENTPERSIAHRLPHQGSGVLSSVSRADGLIILLEDRLYQPGDMVDYIPFTGLM